MAPFLATIAQPRDSTSVEFREQWTLPTDIFSVLLILGGDVVACALAQLAGSGFTPVAFSFGWVAYSVSALVSAFGVNKLMPRDPDCKCKVINGKSGYARDNTSWIIGRVVRDFEEWAHPDTKEKTKSLLKAKSEEMREKKKDLKPPIAGLVVTLYQPSTKHLAGQPMHDWAYWGGCITMVVQLGISAIPCGLFGDWGILMVTAAGIGLSIITGILPQWKKEKWACSRESKSHYVLTRGNGSQHAIVVLGNGRGLNLEDLASGQSNIEVSANISTKIVLFVLCVLWILLLVTAAGIKANSWYLLAVGGVGIAQNISIAGWQRRPENFGIPLEYVTVYGEVKVMGTLLAVEKDYPLLGRSMREEFFPGSLHPDEIEQWEELEKEATAADVKQKAKVECQK